MSKLLKFLSVAICAISASHVAAEETDNALPQVITATEITEVSKEALIEIPTFQKAYDTPLSVTNPADTKPFTPFTGKVRGNKVRLRLNPELDGYVLKELHKNNLLAVVGEKGDFWAVEPIGDAKAYIFRSFVLEGVVEGNHVNLRLEPSLESPIVGHMNTGDKVNGEISQINSKWLEITPPKSVRFYVAKEFLENIGGPEVKIAFEARQAKVTELLDTTALLAKAELRKSFAEMDLERLINNYKVVINDYKEFTEYVEQAKSELATLNETYLQRKIEYLESKANAKDDSLALEDSEEANVSGTDKMKLWEPVEESLYLTWSRINESLEMKEYYDQQKLNAMVLTGIVEPYTSAVKNKPGNFVIRDGDLPVGYVYSTKINLDDLVGKKVSLVVSPRPNNNFAFPAYYVHDLN
jgi:hypothetical protein